MWRIKKFLYDGSAGLPNVVLSGIWNKNFKNQIRCLANLLKFGGPISYGEVKGVIEEAISGDKRAGRDYQLTDPELEQAQT